MVLWVGWLVVRWSGLSKTRLSRCPSLRSEIRFTPIPRSKRNSDITLSWSREKSEWTFLWLATIFVSFLMGIKLLNISNDFVFSYTVEKSHCRILFSFSSGVGRGSIAWIAIARKICSTQKLLSSCHFSCQQLESCWAVVSIFFATINIKVEFFSYWDGY